MQLLKINDLNKFINAQGKITTNLYNKNGEVILKRGRTPSQKLRNKFSSSTDELPEIYIEDTEKRPVEISSKKTVSEEEEKELQKKEVARKRDTLVKIVGKKVLTEYDKACDSMLKTLSVPLDAEKKKQAESFVDDTFRIDRVKLNSCIQELRTVDTYTLHHSLAVSVKFTQALYDIMHHKCDDYYQLFTQKNNNIKMNEYARKQYGLGALLHDFGKKYMLEVVTKRETLTKEEFEKIKTHPLLGVNSLVSIGIKNPYILQIVGNHHAKYCSYLLDENGRALIGQGVLAEICNIVDIYDACRSKRYYKKEFNLEETLTILKNECIDNNWNRFIFNVITKETIPKLEKELVSNL